MSGSVRLVAAGMLAVLAIGLLGFSAWNYRSQLEDQKAEVAFLTEQLNARKQSLGDAYAAVFDARFFARVDEMVATDSIVERAALYDDIRPALAPVPALFDQGQQIVDALRAIEEAPTLEGREAARAELGLQVEIVGEYLFAGNLLLEPMSPKLFGVVTGLITAVGGVGSGLVAFLMFLTGGRKREIETDMLAVDLEMKRVALAKARFDAQEAMRSAGSAHEAVATG